MPSNIVINQFQPITNCSHSNIDLVNHILPGALPLVWPLPPSDFYEVVNIWTAEKHPSGDRPDSAEKIQVQLLPSLVDKQAVDVAAIKGHVFNVVTDQIPAQHQHADPPFLGLPQEGKEEVFDRATTEVNFGQPQVAQLSSLLLHVVEDHFQSWTTGSKIRFITLHLQNSQIVYHPDSLCHIEELLHIVVAVAL